MNIVNLGYTTLRFYVAWSIAFLAHMVAWCACCVVSRPSKWGGLNYRLMKTISLWALKVSGISLVIKQAELFPANGPVVVVANHQSYLDIIAIVESVPRQVAFVAKKELARLPFIGWHLTFQGHLLINRSTPKQARTHLLKMAPDMTVKQKVVVIFPEGTRSKTGELGRFKSGAFELAQQAGATVVPVYIQGSGRIFGKGSLGVTPGPLSVTIGPSFSTHSTADELRQTVRDWYDTVKSSSQKGI